MFNTHNQTQRLIDSAMVHCLYNYPAGYTSHHLHRYKVHLPTFLHVNLASVYLSKGAAEARLAAENKWTLLYCHLLCCLTKKSCKVQISNYLFQSVYVCLCVYLWMHVCMFYRCWRLKRLGRADPIEHRCVRCARTAAIPSPFHNREDVDRRNTVNIEGNHYAICPITKEKVKKRKIKRDSVTCLFLSLVVINERLDGLSGTLIS